MIITPLIALNKLVNITNLISITLEAISIITCKKGSILVGIISNSINATVTSGNSRSLR